jgi:hypothetical protein
MMEFGSRPTERNLLLSAQFLHKELPIRIARRAFELEYLPFGLSNKPPVLKVRRRVLHRPPVCLSVCLSLSFVCACVPDLANLDFALAGTVVSTVLTATCLI